MPIEGKDGDKGAERLRASRSGDIVRQGAEDFDWRTSEARNRRDGLTCMGDDDLRCPHPIIFIFILVSCVADCQSSKRPPQSRDQMG